MTRIPPTADDNCGHCGKPIDGHTVEQLVALHPRTHPRQLTPPQEPPMTDYKRGDRVADKHDPDIPATVTGRDLDTGDPLVTFKTTDAVGLHTYKIPAADLVPAKED